MAKFTPQEINLENINNGERLVNPSLIDAEWVNNAIEASAYAQETADTAKNTSENAVTDIGQYKNQIDNKVNDLETKITEKQGTVVKVGGVAQSEIGFAIDPQTQLDEKATKTELTEGLAGKQPIGDYLEIPAAAYSDPLTSGLWTQCNQDSILDCSAGKKYMIFLYNILQTNNIYCNRKELLFCDGKTNFIIPYSGLKSGETNIYYGYFKFNANGSINITANSGTTFGGTFYYIEL